MIKAEAVNKSLIHSLTETIMYLSNWRIDFNGCNDLDHYRNSHSGSLVCGNQDS
jgi:hypothetical protein